MAYAQQQHHSPQHTRRHSQPPADSYRPSSARPVVTLDNFNEHAGECMINSPRSLAAMKRLGIAPHELLFRPPSHRSFQEGVDQQTAELLPDYVQRRFNHYEHKRQAKIRALREEREAAIQAGASGRMILYGHQGSDSQLVHQARERASTAIEMEKEEIARMQQRLLTKLNNTLAFEIRRAQTLDRAQAKVAYANARAEAEKNYRAQLQAEKEAHAKQHVIEQQRRLAEEAEERRLAAEEAWHATQQHRAEMLEAEREKKRRERAAQVDHRNRTEEKRRQLEHIQEMQRRTIAEKEARLAWKEQERLRNQEEARRQLAEYNDAASRAAKEKLEAAAARSAAALEEKRRRFIDKELAAEMKRREFEDAREWERYQAKQRAKAKEEAIKNAQAHAAALQQAKAYQTLAKEQSTAERLAERARIRAADEHERKMWMQDRERHRRAILEQSYERREERGQQILAKRAALNRRSNEAMRQRQLEISERKLEERMLLQDRKEQVARMQRIQENQREQLLARIQSDRERVDSLQQQSRALAQQRLKLREMAEKQQAVLLDQFEKLRAHPEQLARLDPNNVDVIKMGFLSRQDVAALMSFNDQPDYESETVHQGGMPAIGSHSRTHSTSPPQHHRRSSSRRYEDDGSGLHLQQTIMDRPLPRPHTQQTPQRPKQEIHQQQRSPSAGDFARQSQDYLEYAQTLQTH